jgi:hypothetical protein
VRQARFTLGAAVLYLTAAWFVYGQTLSAPYLFDDYGTIVNNPSIRSLWPGTSLNPPPAPVSFSRRPVANFTMALNYAAGDLQIEGYRVFNLAWHALNAFLLFLFLRFVAVKFLFLPSAVAQWSAFFAGLLWVVHPLSTSAVHYLTQRPELLAAGAAILMMYFQAWSFFSSHPWRWLAAAWVACLLAMGSKESAVLLPLVALFFDRCAFSWNWREQWRRRGVYYSLLVATIVWPLHLLAKDSAGLVLHADLDERWRYFLTVTEGLMRHATMIAWPTGQVFDYGTKLVSSVRDVAFPFVAVTAAVAAVCLGLYRRSLFAWFGAAAFAVLLPSWLNMAPGQPVAEHRFYLPAGLLIGVLFLFLGSRCARRPFFGALFIAGSAISCAFYFACSVQRSALYAKPSALMLADTLTWPRGDRTHMNLGLALELEEDFEGAARQYKLAAGSWSTANWRPPSKPIRRRDSSGFCAMTSILR